MGLQYDVAAGLPAAQALGEQAQGFGAAVDGLDLQPGRAQGAGG